MNCVKLINSKLSVEEISNLVSSPECGAISIFVGTTRDNFQQHKVLQLEYEAYEAMATKAMLDICGDIRKKWPSVQHIAIYHRLGIVPVQEASVVIAISSPHRAESLAAVGFTIDALKASVPIWKKEIYDSEKPDEWKENSESFPDLSKRMKAEETSPFQDDHSHSTDADPLAHIDFTPINRKLIQIKADDQEIQRRMQRFIERKREDLNVINSREFCNHSFRSEEENSCARVDALVFRRSDSKSHLRIHRVRNQRGPQCRGNDEGYGVESDALPNKCMESISQSLDTASPSSKTGSQTMFEDKLLPTAVEERLQNAEKHLGIEGPISKDVYSRLQKIEARILYLEGLSPEYATFWVTQGMNRHPDTYKTRKKKVYSADDLENKILQYQKKTVK